MPKRGGNRWRNQRGSRGPGPRGERVDYTEVAKSNEKFETYYNNITSFDQSEKEEFWDALRRELPNSFRFAGSKGHAIPVQKLLKERYLPEIESIEYNGAKVEPPNQIPWFPDQLAWQMTTPKNVVRRFAPFKSFQQFLVSETSVGNISRQEIVSMIPPLLMDIKPGMTVLDLCAAPGSKSAQLIEMVHGGEEARIRKTVRDMKKREGREVSPDGEAVEQEIEDQQQTGDWSDGGRSTGLLIANDVDYKRAHMLIHQMKRLNSPNLIVTNHDATMFPSIRLPSESNSDGKRGAGTYLKFDRVLADVPCSGDGTSRKNYNVWKDWTPGNALGLHAPQVRILVRALQMTKPGGKVVYSTCSMNPVENEAVIASAIERCGGPSKIDIIDCAEQLPGLKRKPGYSSWKVMDREGQMWESWEHAKDNTDRLIEGMFPPKEPLAFDRCMRIYPHLQDTGAFFITVLEKKSEIRAKPEPASQRADVKKPSIVSVVNEIEAKPIDDTNPISKIDALDDIAPVHINGDGATTAVERQNKEAPHGGSLSPRKHDLDDQADAYMSAKRIKTRDEVDPVALRGAEDRQVHWPPPPGAQLEISRPETMDLPEPDNPQPQTMVPNETSKFDPTAPYKNKRNSGQQAFEEPFKYLSVDHPELELISTFYALSPNFPKDRFMVRNATGNPVKTIYYTSALARDILTANEGSGMKFVHCGVKMFVKQDVQKEGVCKWRIQTDGLPVLEAWVGEERVVRLWRKQTLRDLLIEMFPKVDGEGWRLLGEIGERVRDIEMGCCVLKVEKGEGEDAFSERMVLPLWRSLHSLNLMLPKEERKAMLLRIFNDDTPLQDHSKDRFRDKKMTANGTVGEQSEVRDEDERETKDDENEDKEVEEEVGVALGGHREDLQAIIDASSDSIADDEENEIVPGLGRGQGEGGG